MIIKDFEDYENIEIFPKLDEIEKIMKASRNTEIQQWRWNRYLMTGRKKTMKIKNKLKAVSSK